MSRIVPWILSRVGMIYILILVFAVTCVDLKNVDMRIKTRRLNDAIPDFSDMLIFAKAPQGKPDINWDPYRDYFQLILSYIPDDPLIKQLLGYVEYNLGHEKKALALFKKSSEIKGRFLFWSNYDLGVIYYKKGQWLDAADYLFKTAESNVQLSVMLAQNSIVFKQIFVSPYFKYSISDDINAAQSQAYILLLSALAHLKQYEKMLIVAKLALANPNFPDKDAFYFYTGLACYQTGQMDRAFMLFNKSLELEKENPETYYYLAGIYQGAGKLKEAEYFLKISYTLHQKNDPRFPYDKRVQLGFI